MPAGWCSTAICAQCHSIYGSKQGTVGPDLTGVGRENLDAVLTNVLDPSLVIGAPYLVYVAKTKDGETYSGILVEKSDQRIVLKDPTKQMVIPAADLEKLTVQNISMMPEGLEKTMSEQEFIDLVAFMLTREPLPERKVTGRRGKVQVTSPVAAGSNNARVLASRSTPCNRSMRSSRLLRFILPPATRPRSL